jgi:hypothetical protein
MPVIMLPEEIPVKRELPKMNCSVVAVSMMPPLARSPPPSLESPSEAARKVGMTMVSAQDACGASAVRHTASMQAGTHDDERRSPRMEYLLVTRSAQPRNGHGFHRSTEVGLYATGT